MIYNVLINKLKLEIRNKIQKYIDFEIINKILIMFFMIYNNVIFDILLLYKLR